MNSGVSIEDITLLHQVYYHGSITKAAESLRMSQSNLSKKLQAIEEKLGGIKMFNRSTRKLSITPAGQQFLDDTASIPQTLDLAISALKDQQSQIRIDLSVSLSNAHVPGFIRKQNVVSDLNLRVALHSQQEIIRRLRVSAIDVAILPYTHELDQVAKIHQQIDDQFVLLINHDSAPPSEKFFAKWIAQQKWLLPDRSDITHHQIKSWLRQEGAECEASMEIPNFDLINHLVALGHGVSIVPQRSLRLFYNKKLIQPITLAKRYCRKIVVASPLERLITDDVSEFLESIVF